MNVDDPEAPILVEVKDWNFASNISMGKATISNPQPQPYLCPNPNPNPILTLTLSLALTLALTVTRQGQDLPQRVQGHGGQGDAPRPRERQPRRHTRQCDMVPALVVSVGALQTSFLNRRTGYRRAGLNCCLTRAFPPPAKTSPSERALGSARRRLDHGRDVWTTRVTHGGQACRGRGFEM
jgi:hypothetical protein